MKKLTFVLVGTVVLLTAACNRGNEDEVNNAEMNQPASDLNALANDAANTEVNNLGNQQEQLNNEASAVDDNTINPKDADEQNVSGM